MAQESSCHWNFRARLGLIGSSILTGGPASFIFIFNDTISRQQLNLKPHSVVFIHNPYWLWGASVILTPPSPTHLFSCRKLREYSARSYWSTAERCDNRQRTSIGRHAERSGNLLLFVDRRMNHWGVSAGLIPSEQGLYMPNFFIFLFLTR